MDSHHLALVHASLRQVAPSDDAALNVFTEELARICGTVNPDEDPVHARRRRALDLMAAAVRLLRVPEEFGDVTSALVPRPMEIDTAIQAIDYDYAGNAVLKTLRKRLGRDFTTEAWNAWVETLHVLAQRLPRAELALTTSPSTRPA